MGFLVTLRVGGHSFGKLKKTIFRHEANGVFSLRKMHQPEPPVWFGESPIRGRYLVTLVHLFLSNLLPMAVFLVDGLLLLPLESLCHKYTKSSVVDD
jgi:hypothetical protein